MEAETRFEYYAFISYSHKDKKWAEWLQHQLEHYKIPTSLHKESDRKLPKKVRPVFRDQTDLGVGSLEFNLRKELTDSRYLIVLCSPDSAKSDWVNKEIEHFREMGRQDRIIPVIISGEPGSGSADECYPSGLKETDIWGIRLSEKKEKEALIHIVARLLELDFDMLWEREIKEQKSRKRRIVLIGSGLVVVIGVCSWAVWDYNFHEKTEYFSNYVEIYGVANGVDPLTLEQVSKRNLSYRITRLKGKVISFEKVNGSGCLCSSDAVVLDSEFLPIPDMPTKIEYSYNEHRSLDKAMYFKKNGLHIVTLQYSSTGDEKPQVANIYMSEKTAEGGWSSSLLSEQPKKQSTIPDETLHENNDVNRFIFEYDDQGKTTKKSYFNMYNAARRNEDGIFAETYSYDEKGRLTKIEYVDDQGSAYYDQNGIYSITFMRNSQGDINQIIYYDVSGNETVNQKTYSRIELAYENGNIVEEKYLIKDDLTLVDDPKESDAMENFASVREEYDDKGNLIKLSYYGLDGKPTKVKSDKTSSIVTKYDERGYVTYLSHLDENDCTVACLIENAEYDDRGNQIKKITTNQSIEKCYDNRGNVIKEMIYDKSGTLVDGYTEYHYTYNEDNGHCLERQKIHYDKNGIISPKKNLIYAIIKSEYNEKGDETSISYYDANQQACLQAKEGYSSSKMEYNNFGKKIKTTYYGTDGKIKLYNDNPNQLSLYAITTTEYNNRGQLLKWSSFDANGLPTIEPSNGYASYSFDYDDQGNEIKMACYGTNGELIKANHGYATRITEYDEKRNRTKQSFYGVNDEPVLNYMNYASEVTIYNELGKSTKISYFGVNGEPVYYNKGNRSYTEFVYDENGKLIKSISYDVAGNLV